MNVCNHAGRDFQNDCNMNEYNDAISVFMNKRDMKESDVAKSDF